MSARVLNPAATMMMEMNRIVSSSSTPPTNSGLSGNNSNNTGRIQPSRAALAKVRRDLFGPVDHADARALAENELKSQSIKDTERWGFDFRLEVPKNSNTSRFEWEIVASNEHVPEPYAFRGMPYIKRNSPSTPRKSFTSRSPRIVRIRSTESSPITTTIMTIATIPTPVKDIHKAMLESERTPPQDNNRNSLSLVAITPEVVPAIADLSFRSKEKNTKNNRSCSTPSGLSRKQSAITGWYFILSLFKKNDSKFYFIFFFLFEINNDYYNRVTRSCQF